MLRAVGGWASITGGRRVGGAFAGVVKGGVQNEDFIGAHLS